MTTSTETRLRRVDTKPVEWAVATFEVILKDGAALGTVTKYDMPSERNAGSRRRPHYEPQRAIRWAADIYGTDDDELHQRRKDAVDLLLHVRKNEQVTTDAPPFEVLPQQTYAPCKTEYLWGETRHKPFVVLAVVGDKAEVWDPTGGQRLGGRRWVSLRNLHETGTTQQGKERRTGWRLHSGPPTKGQELCGSCFLWLDLDQFDVTAWTYGHSTCMPCKAEIKRMYGGIE